MKNKNVLGLVLGLGLMNIYAIADETAHLAGQSSFKNPAVGVNFLTLIQGSSNVSNEDNGIKLQKVELSFDSAVDSFFTAKAVFSVEQGAGVWGIHPEEVFAHAVFNPTFDAKVGKFYAAFGLHNELYTHDFYFVDAPLMNAALLGDEGLNEAGASVTGKLPFPGLSTLTIQAFSNNTTKDALYNGRLVNLWKTGEDHSVQLGVSGLAGKNVYGQQSDVFGADLTFKHKPLQAAGKLWVLGAEVMQGKKHDFAPGAPDNAFGFSGFTEVECTKKMFVQYRFDGYLQDRRNSFLLGYAPSSYSMIRAQYSLKVPSAGVKENIIMLQTNFSMGAHPAHSY